MLEYPKLSYKRTVTLRANYFEIVTCEWTDECVTSMHHHEWSSCFIYVEKGTFQDTINLGLKTEINILETGQSTTTPIGAKHELKCLSKTGKTLHIYIPSFGRTENPISLEQKIFSPKNLDFKELDIDSESIKWEKLLSALNLIRDNSITTHSPYFMNQLFSGILPEMLISENLLSQMKTTLATYEASPILNYIEEELIRNICKLFAWESDQQSGITVPGGSAANLMAVHCARHKIDPNIKKIGIGNKKFKLFVSKESHYSFEKACVILGIGTENLVKIDIDEFKKMKASALESAIQIVLANNEIPLLICATAGTTVYGAFDQIDEIAKISQKYKIWLHVDAAWGAPVLFSKNTRKLMDGISLADSITFDAHKLLGANLTSSFFLTRHVNILKDANDVDNCDYLFHQNANGIDKGQMTWQCGRKGEFLSFWSIWKSVGTIGLGDFVDRLYKIRNEVLEYIKEKDRLELLHSPEYLNLCVKINPPNKKYSNFNWSKIVRNKLIDKNLAMINYSQDENGFFLRFIIANPFLESYHIKQMLDWCLEIE